MKAVKPPLKVQMRELKRAAAERGLRIRHTPSLSKTPFRAMNPLAAKENNIPWPKDLIGYDGLSCGTTQMNVMDIRHEIVEYDYMKDRRRHYKSAHKVANKKQERVNSVVSLKNIKASLRKSIKEEHKADSDYRRRAGTADPKSAKLLLHIAKEERGHAREFTTRLKHLEGKTK
jgi:hypothetical protein